MIIRLTICNVSCEIGKRSKGFTIFGLRVLDLEFSDACTRFLGAVLQGGYTDEVFDCRALNVSVDVVEGRGFG